MYLDDSASHGAVLNKRFQVIETSNNGFMPVSTAGGIVVQRKHERQIVRDIEALRREIQKVLRTDFLPELHMREMWGKDIRKYRNNPFIPVSMEQRAKWVRSAYDIIFKYGKQGILRTCGASLEISSAQDAFKQHYESEDGRDEYEIIRKYFPKATKQHYDVALNPLCRNITNMLAVANYFCVVEETTMDIYYDTSHASKGFSTSEGMKILRENGHFPLITGFEESTPHQLSLLQLADVAQYNFFRKSLMAFRRKNKLPNATDEGMDAVRRGRDTAAIAIRGPHPNLQLYSMHENQFAMLHTAYAAEKIREEYPKEMCDLYLVNPRHYDIRPAPLDGKMGFFPVILPSVLENWRNGKRPPL